MAQREKLQQGCMLCGKELEYLDHPVQCTCIFCGAVEHGYFCCPDGHYVCNRCHANDALVKMSSYCLKAKSTDPLVMLEELMADPSVAMHGPEHHALVPAVLVTAYRNATGALDDQAILEAIRRGAQVPGGYCGLCGACGAGIGTGIAVAVITGSTPLKAEPRALSNLMTAKALNAIAEQGGARCCKACSRTALSTALDFIAEYLDCCLAHSQIPQCTYMGRNRQCNLQQCVYFPQKKSDFSTSNS